MKRVLGVLLALAGLGLLSWQAFFHIDFDAEPLNLLPQELPQVEAMRAYDKAFASQIDVLIAVTQEDVAIGEEATVSLEEHLRERRDLFTSLSHRPPWEQAPSQMGELLAYLWANGPPSAMEAMVERLSGDGAARELSKSLDLLENSMDLAAVTRVSHDPFHLSNLGEGAGGFQLGDAMRMSFVSDDGELHLLLAEPNGDLKDGDDVVAWQAAVEASLEAWRSANPELAEGTRIQLTGRKIYMTEVTNALRGDLMISVLITLAFVVVLFGLIYRRIVPLLLLLASLYVTFVLTLLIGEQVFGSLSPMSVGFAAILMGLAVDYGFVIYQESCCSGKDPRRSRRVFGRSIGWAALTTACVFLALNRSIMPGVAQLGTMVAIGVSVGALMMIFPYASGLGSLRCYGFRGRETSPPPGKPWLASGRFAAWLSCLMVLGLVVILSSMGFPRLDSDPEKLRPERRQPALELYKSVMEKLGGDRRTLTVMASGDDEETVLQIFQRGREILEAEPTVSGTMIPIRLWPNEANQRSNRELVRTVIGEEANLLAVAEAEGFTDEALVLTKRAFLAWREWIAGEGAFRVEDAASRWLLDRLIQTSPESHRAIGFVRMAEDAFTLPEETVKSLNQQGLRPIGWEFLTPAIGQVLRHDIKHVVIPTALILLALLAMVFRSVKGVCISIALLGFSALMLMAVMMLMGRDWNIVNIAAGPLLLGLGLDYSIHVILALRRTHGNVVEIRQNIGRALLLCGTTTAVGFASLRSARHGGLPMLGELCAIGILITMVTAIFLVPHWWRALHREELHDRTAPDDASS